MNSTFHALLASIVLSVTNQAFCQDSIKDEAAGVLGEALKDIPGVPDHVTGAFLRDQFAPGEILSLSATESKALASAPDSMTMGNYNALGNQHEKTAKLAAPFDAHLFAVMMNSNESPRRREASYRLLKQSLASRERKIASLNMSRAKQILVLLLQVSDRPPSLDELPNYASLKFVGGDSARNTDWYYSPSGFTDVTLTSADQALGDLAVLLAPAANLIDKKWIVGFQSGSVKSLPHDLVAEALKTATQSDR